jgi:hypothetical protein
MPIPIFIVRCDYCGEPCKRQTDEHGNVTYVCTVGHEQAADLPAPAGEPAWGPGDIVLDAKGRIRVRSRNPLWPWGYPDEGERGQVPSGSLADTEVERPLVLLVRDGRAVTNVVTQS